jgi:hypothetical protein
MEPSRSPLSTLALAQHLALVRAQSEQETRARLRKLDEACSQKIEWIRASKRERAALVIWRFGQRVLKHKHAHDGALLLLEARRAAMEREEEMRLRAQRKWMQESLLAHEVDVLKAEIDEMHVVKRVLRAERCRAAVRIQRFIRWRRYTQRCKPKMGLYVLSESDDEGAQAEAQGAAAAASTRLV